MQLINNRNLFLTSLETGGLDQVPVWLDPGEGPLEGCRLLTSLCYRIVEGVIHTHTHAHAHAHAHTLISFVKAPPL